jgi:hypothetical protein
MYLCQDMLSAYGTLFTVDVGKYTYTKVCAYEKRKFSLLPFRGMKRPLLFTKRNGIPRLFHFATETEFRRSGSQFLVSSSAV